MLYLFFDYLWLNEVSLFDYGVIIAADMAVIMAARVSQLK